jgi:hypothetical protein
MARRLRRHAVRAAVVASMVSFPAIASAQSSSSGAGEAAAGILALLFTGGMSAFMCLMYAVVPALSIASTVLWILALVDLAQRNDSQFPSAIEGRPNANEKVVWLLVVLLAGAVGAAVYYFVVMKKYPRDLIAT